MISNNGNHLKVTAVILTGGSGKRMQQGSVPKQFIEIMQKPIFIHCLEIFQNIPAVDDIILVIEEKYRPLYKEVLKKYKVTKVKRLVSGGAFRHESVQNGVNAVSHEDIVIIQNGVNPTTSSEIIKHCIDKTVTHSAVSAYVPAFHTVFSNIDETIEKVYPRNTLGYTVDPQVYKVSTIKKALKLQGSSEEDLPIVELIRNAGFQVALVKSDMSNHKITNSYDLAYVQHVLESRELTLEDKSNTQKN